MELLEVLRAARFAGVVRPSAQRDLAARKMADETGRRKEKKERGEAGREGGRKREGGWKRSKGAAWCQLRLERARNGLPLPGSDKTPMLQRRTTGIRKQQIRQE